MYWQNNFIVSFGQLLQGEKVTESKSIFGQIYFFPIFVGHHSSEKGIFKDTIKPGLYFIKLFAVVIY
jgi:hypothetical protein